MGRSTAARLRLAALAAQLQPRPAPSGGPTVELSHIMKELRSPPARGASAASAAADGAAREAQC
jgi:hypothetical protein